MGRPLSDDEVNREMKKMVAFISQEASEKAREIEVKADEEFNIEKAKLVRYETAVIEENFARKSKQAELRRKVAHSALINKARLRVLQAYDDILDKLLEQARENLHSLAERDLEQYQELLKAVALQSIFKLMEASVVARCRQKDVDIVQKALEWAAVSYRSQTNLPFSYILDSHNYLPASSAGGIELWAQSGKIQCNNTLDSRLELVCEAMLPDIRLMLLGPSKPRKFFD